MKKYYLLFAILVSLSLFNFYCESNHKVNDSEQIIKIDSLYSINNIQFVKRLFKFDGGNICTSHFADNQLISIKIENNNLFQKFRDSLEFQSDRLIGVQILGYHCAGCHDFRAQKLVDLAQNNNEFSSFLLNSSHKINLKDSLNSDEIYFIRSYLNSLK